MTCFNRGLFGKVRLSSQVLLVKKHDAPFKVVYGRDPLVLVMYEPGVSRLAAVDRQLVDCDEFLAEIREHLLQAQTSMKEH